MSEYKLIPREAGLPSPTDLLEALHRREFSVEVNVTGPSGAWEALRFYQDGPAEVECFLIRDEETGALTASTPEGSPERAQELLSHLCDLILSGQGGTARDLQTGKLFTSADFKENNPHLKSPARPRLAWAWPAFAWALVLGAGAAYFNLPDNLHMLALAVVGLSLLSALGLTISALDE
ncbi:MAG TPA: hypothetical protein VMU88_10420 [bacterium]|nr:hypothetical protein [bacterium]